MRWRIATLLLSITVLALVVVFGRDVSVPPPVPTGPAHRESAWMPYVQQDYGGATSWCVSSVSGRIMPPYIDTSP